MILLFLTMGCSRGMDYKQYLVWYESSENPLRKTVTVGDVEYTFTYLATDYFMARELASTNKSKKEKEDESEYYKLNIKIKDFQEPLTYHLKNASESYERINYLVTNVKDDILLLTSKDTISCQMHHYERVYHVGNTLSVMFIFDKTNEKSNRTIAFNDRLFNNDVVTVTFNQDEINSLPKLIK